MANIRAIRRRIRSVQSTAKITKAMEMVATSKMKRAQERDLAGRPYAEKIQQVLGDLVAEQGRSTHPLLERREVKKIEIIHITTDRGLCGGLNANMNRSTGNFVVDTADRGVPSVLITVGRKGRDYMLRYGREIRAEFTGMSDKPTLLDTLPISRIVIDDYTSKQCDVVYLAYSKFITTMSQRPVLQQLLPVEPTRRERKTEIEYIYEPSRKDVLAELLPRFVEMEVYHAVLESIASEQSARMVAMRNATDNAKELIQDLTLMYNKARQEMITKELLDIVGGAEAIA
ncbi:MAG: ATP synthase F1 subunit gamma [Dehalococcoidia bacterium]|nr:ATP synthase F1 subunit gamma [Dehalococcoidia bacterium]